jgi:hypothetical protein
MGEVFINKDGARAPLNLGEVYNPRNDLTLPVFRVGVEMEGYGRNGEEITGPELYEKVSVAAPDEEEAERIVFEELSFGNRQPSYAEVHRDKEE